MDLQRLGSDYGGWTVDLDAIPERGFILDVGVGRDVSFAESLTTIRPGLSFVFVDPDPACGDWLKTRAPAQVAHGVFICGAVSTMDGSVKLWKNRNPAGGSDSLVMANSNSGRRCVDVAAVSLRTLIKKFSPVLVKLDIEGTEFDVFDDTYGVPQVAMEFHERLIPGKSWADVKAIAERFIARGYSSYQDRESITFVMGDQSRWVPE